MNSIKEIRSWPDGATVEALAVKITKVWEHKQKKGKPGTQQNFKAQELNGDEIDGTAWDHDDLSPLEGKTVIIYSTKGQKGFGGVEIKKGTGQYEGKDKIWVSKSGQFQTQEVYQQQSGKTVAPAAKDVPSQQADGSGQTGPARINGQTVGMALKLAGDTLIHDEFHGTDSEWAKNLYSRASAIVKVSQHMEAGHLAVKATETPKAANPEPQVEAPKAKPEDEEPPF